MMKIVNAQSKRVNSRRVGGAVHLELLVWRGMSGGPLRGCCARGPVVAIGGRNVFVVGDEPVGELLFLG